MKIQLLIFFFFLLYVELKNLNVQQKWVIVPSWVYFLQNNKQTNK